MKTWEELTLSDDFIFKSVMEDEEICKEFLEKLLRVKIEHIVYSELEKFFKPDKESKGIRLDVYVEDEKGTAYDVEMQTTNSPFDSLPKRALYYQSLIVANQIKKGQDYQDLKKTFVIFVCTFDPFGEGRIIYSSPNINAKPRIWELNGGATQIFLNTKGISGKVDKDIKRLIDFINGADAQGKFTKKIEEKLDEVKRNDRLKVKYMSGYAEEMRIRRISYAEGIAEGETRKTFEMIKNFLSVKTPIEFIVKATGWTEEKILEFAKAEGIAAEKI